MLCYHLHGKVSSYKSVQVLSGFQAGPYFPYFLITALIFLIWTLKS